MFVPNTRDDSGALLLMRQVAYLEAHPVTLGYPPPPWGRVADPEVAEEVDLNNDGASDDDGASDVDVINLLEGEKTQLPPVPQAAVKQEVVKQEEQEQEEEEQEEEQEEQEQEEEEEEEEEQEQEEEEGGEGGTGGG